MGTKPKN